VELEGLELEGLELEGLELEGLELEGLELEGLELEGLELVERENVEREPLKPGGVEREPVKPEGVGQESEVSPPVAEPVGPPPPARGSARARPSQGIAPEDLAGRGRLRLGRRTPTRAATPTHSTRHCRSPLAPARVGSPNGPPEGWKRPQIQVYGRVPRPRPEGGSRWFAPTSGRSVRRERATSLADASGGRPKRAR
jgi:hypothetical protein